MNSTTDFTNNAGTVSNSANPGAVSNQTGVSNGPISQDQDLSYNGFKSNFWTNNFLGQLIDNIFLGGSRAKQADIDYKNWLNTHATAMKMQDLRNAGLNPFLAGMSIGAPNSAMYGTAGDNMTTVSGKNFDRLLDFIKNLLDFADDPLGSAGAGGGDIPLPIPA